MLALLVVAGAKTSRPEGPVQVVSRDRLHHLHVRPRHRLVAQSGGLEGIERLVKPGIADDPPLADGPERRLPPFDLQPAAATAGRVAHGNGHEVSARPELLWLHLPDLPA